MVTAAKMITVKERPFKNLFPLKATPRLIKKITLVSTHPIHEYPELLELYMQLEIKQQQKRKNYKWFFLKRP